MPFKVDVALVAEIEGGVDLGKVLPIGLLGVGPPLGHITRAREVEEFIQEVAREAARLAQHSGRKTIVEADIRMAVRRKR